MTNFEKLKIFCGFEFTAAQRVKIASPSKALDRCYGAMMFTANYIEDYSSEEAEKICKWWDDEMLPKFRELGA